MRALLTPRMLAAHLLALVLVATAGALAFWQYEAWSARRAAEAVDLTALTPVPLAEAIGPDDPFPGDQVGQPVEITGTWLPEATVLVSDRELDGVTGFWVVTPLSVDATGSAIPVVRGWSADPTSVPDPPRGEASLTGYLQPSEGRTVTDDDPTDDVLPQLRTADILQRVDQDLYGAYVVETPDRAAGAENDGTEGLGAASLAQLPPAGRFTALRNLLYAIEWVVFGGFAAFVWWRFVREARDAAAAGPPEDEASDDGQPGGGQPGGGQPGGDSPRDEPAEDHPVASRP